MRVLFSFAGGNGHFQPMVPVARAVVAAGHVVACTGEPSMGATIEAAEFEPQPPNVRIERYLPQDSVLPRCSVVVSHGGSTRS